MVIKIFKLKERKHIEHKTQKKMCMRWKNAGSRLTGCLLWGKCLLCRIEKTHEATQHAYLKKLRTMPPQVDKLISPLEGTARTSRSSISWTCYSANNSKTPPGLSVRLRQEKKILKIIHTFVSPLNHIIVWDHCPTGTTVSSYSLKLSYQSYEVEFNLLCRILEIL